jgi:signal transduction histidine kinase
MFFGLVLHNAICLPIATFQLGLNAAVVAVYLVTGSIDINIRSEETTIPQPLPKKKVVRAPVEPEAEDSPDVAEPFHLRVGVLTLWALWCYALQALFEKGRKAQVEAEEFGIRQEQLQTAGRLAAEIAHKLKNPLSIINNAAFSLQRSLSNQSGSLEQIQIIREEVDRADRILTELMGYARLAEGRVERLSVVEELDRAILTVFPPGAGYPVKVVRDYRLALPSLLMHRGHLSEIFVNLIQNAREAMPQGGTLTVTAEYGQSYSVLVKIRDTGPGIPQEKAVQIFEPYFTTKQKGTGLGLAIVKHNLDIYGGSIEVESELGIGTCFVLEIPAKPLLNLRK